MVFCVVDARHIFTSLHLKNANRVRSKATCMMVSVCANCCGAQRQVTRDVIYKFNTFFSLPALLFALLPFCTTLLVSSLLMLATVFGLEQREGKPKIAACSLALRQTREFGIWVCLSAQVMASASSSPAPNLPEWILNVYAFVSFFNFDTDYVVHESCLQGDNPYMSTTLLLIGILSLTMLQCLSFVCMKSFKKKNKKNKNDVSSTLTTATTAAAAANWDRYFDALNQQYYLVHRVTRKTKWESQQEKENNDRIEGALTEKNNNSDNDTHVEKSLHFIWLAHVQGNIFVAMSFAFPLISRHVLKMLHCEKDPITNEMILAEGSTRTVCWDSAIHLSLGILSIAVMVVYMLAYPIASGCYLRKIVNERNKSKHRLARWDHFISDDYKPRYYWFRHVYWAVNFSLLFVYEFLPHGILRFGAILCIFVSYTFLLFRHRPFTLIDRWKLWVRMCLVVASILIALLNVIRWAEDTKEQSNVIGDTTRYRTSTTLSPSPDPTAHSAAPSPASFLNANLAHNSTSASTMVAYFLFVACMSLPVVLPFSFFYTNYNLCNPKKRRGQKKQGKDQESEDDEVDTTELVNIAVEMKEQNSSIDSKKSDASEWSRHYSQDHGHHYIVSSITGESKWLEGGEGGEVADGKKTNTLPPKDMEGGVNIEVVNPMSVRHYRRQTTGPMLPPRATHNTEKMENTKHYRRQSTGPMLPSRSGSGSSSGSASVAIDEEDDDKKSTRLRNEKRYRQLALDSGQLAVLGWIELAGPPVVYCNVETGDIMYKKPRDWVKSMRNVFESGDVSNVSLKKRQAHHHRARTK